MATQIENIRKRTEKSLASIERDINSLLAIIEERGQLIDGLAREREALREFLDDLGYTSIHINDMLSREEQDDE